jgi:uncharacterized membrane protein YeiH
VRFAAIGGAVEAAAVLLFAVSGMITAARKRMDIVGTYSLAVVTAFGGGTLRDLLVGRRPFFWVARWEYLVVIAVLCIGFVYRGRCTSASTAGTAPGSSSTPSVSPCSR